MLLGGNLCEVLHVLPDDFYSSITLVALFIFFEEPSHSRIFTLAPSQKIREPYTREPINLF